MGLLTEDDVALLNDTQLAHIGTTSADGTPHVTPVWVEADQGQIVFNTAKGRVKYENMLRTPVVAVSVVDRADDGRTLWVQGSVELIEEGADAHIDKLAKKYTGADTFGDRRPGQVRVIVRVTPRRKLEFG